MNKEKTQEDIDKNNWRRNLQYRVPPAKIYSSSLAGGLNGRHMAAKKIIKIKYKPMANKKTPTADNVIQDFALLSLEDKLLVAIAVNQSLQDIKDHATESANKIQATQAKINGK